MSSPKATRVWLQLFDELAGRESPRLLAPDTVFLLPDRSLSPAAARRFKDRRCDIFQRMGEPWPNPGVYLFPELARRILRLATERFGQRPLERPQLSRLQLLLTLEERRVERSEIRRFEPALPRSLACRLREAEDLHPLGIPTEVWARLGREILERNLDGGDLASALTIELELRSLSAATEAWVSPWDALEPAADCLRRLPPQLAPDFFARLFEVRPGLEPRRVLVPAYRSLFHGETRFLKALAMHLRAELLEVDPEAPGFEAEQWRELPAAPGDSEGRDDVFWAFPAAKPRAALLLELLPDEHPWDLVEPPMPGIGREARALRLAVDYVVRGRPSDHPLRHGDRARQELSALGVRDTSGSGLGGLEGPGLDFDELLGRLVNDGRLDLASAEALSERLVDPARAAGWIDALASEGYFDGLLDETESAEDNDPRLHPEAPSVFSLEDLPWAGNQLARIWSRPEALEKILSPLSRETLARRILPRDVERWLAAEGFNLPDPSEEAERLARLLGELQPRLCRFEPARPKPGLRPVSFGSRGVADPTRPESASGLQMLLECPRKYYLSRRLKLEDPDPWDGETLSPLKKGNWIHKVLEDFFREASPEDWKRPRARLDQLFERHFEAEAVGRSSEGHKEYLRAHAPAFREALERHLEIFEAPLRKALKPRDFALEATFVPSEAFAFWLRGKIDRIDLTDQGFALWDYKTGSPSSYRKLSSLLSSGEIQWYLYRTLVEHYRLGFEKVPERVFSPGRWLAGGYLQPLEPGRSMIFASESAPGPLLEFLETRASSLYPVKILSAGDEIEARGILESKLQEARSFLDRGEFPARPRSVSDCDGCQVSALCGRHYLTEAES